MLLFSQSFIADSVRPRGLQHTRLPCPSPSPGACSNSHPLSQWCHPTISSSVDPFSSCLQAFPASGSYPTSQLFTSGGQSIAASASVLPVNHGIPVNLMVAEIIKKKKWNVLGEGDWGMMFWRKISCEIPKLFKVLTQQKDTLQRVRVCCQMSYVCTQDYPRMECLKSQRIQEIKEKLSSHHLI